MKYTKTIVHTVTGKTEYVLMVVREDGTWYMIGHETEADALDTQINLPDSDIFGDIAFSQILRCRYGRRNH